LDILKWLRENQLLKGLFTCYYAAKGAQLKVLKWAREVGLPWDTSTCDFAAHGGHLEILKWARENGCPWNKKHILKYCTHEHIINWVKLNLF
jgi:hypothetical protein